MSFKPVSTQKEIEAISRVVSRRESAAIVARDGGIHRTSTYIWNERALSALEERESQIHFLMKRLESQKLQKENLKSIRCPYCGCEKVYKTAFNLIRENQRGSLTT